MVDPVMLVAFNVVTVARGDDIDVNPLTVPPMTDVPVNVVAVRVAMPLTLELGSMIMVVLINPPPVVPDQIAIPELLVVVGVDIDEATADPDIIRPSETFVIVTEPAPAIVLKLRELPVLLMKTPNPVPELFPLVITALPDRLRVSIAFMFFTTKVLPLILVPVILVVFMVVIVASGDVRDVNALIDGETMDVVPLIVFPVMLVAFNVATVASGDVTEVKALTVEPTIAVPLMFVPVMFVAFMVVIVASGLVSDVVLVIV
jgi:hypothetical protein